MKLNYYEERFERPYKLLHVFVKCFLRILTCFNDFNFSRKVLRISHFRKAYERKLIISRRPFGYVGRRSNCIFQGVD